MAHQASRWAHSLTNIDGSTPDLDISAHIGHRRATFRFDLRDGVTNEPKGEVTPVRDSPPTLSHDASQTVSRRVTPFLLSPADTARVNHLRDRVEVAMVVADRSYPLGRYAFADFTQVITAGGTWSSSTLLDEMSTIDQQLETAFTASTPVTTASAAHETIDATIRRLLSAYTVVVVAAATPFFSSGSWPAGTQRGTVIKDLALFGDYLSPWFGNDGKMHLVRSFDPATAVLDLDWDERDVVIRGSIVLSDDLATTPNRIIIVSNDTGAGESTGEDDAAPIFGTYDIPVASPHSVVNRGFVVPDVRELQVTSSAQATALAANIGRRSRALQRAELTTPPDPRHDSYNVIRWQGSNWMELSWSLPLVEGGEMQHVLQRSYE